MRKDVLISALAMVVAGVALVITVPELPEESRDCAFGMVVARDARKRIAQRVQKVFLVSASHMEVVADVSILNVTKVLKEAHCFAKDTVVVNAAHIQGATRVQREAPLSARAMGEANVAPSK